MHVHAMHLPVAWKSQRPWLIVLVAGGLGENPGTSAASFKKPYEATVLRVEGMAWRGHFELPQPACAVQGKVKGLAKVGRTVMAKASTTPDAWLALDLDSTQEIDELAP